MSDFWKKTRNRLRRRVKAPLLAALLRPFSLRSDELLHRRRSDTLFVLGSGPSILDLTPQQWEHIASQDTLGLNFWVYHRFVPTYLHYEVRYLGLPPHLEGSTHRHFQRLVAMRADYRKVTWLLGAEDSGLHVRLRDLPGLLGMCRGGAGVYFYRSRSGFTDRERALTAEDFRDAAASPEGVHPRPVAASLGVAVSLARSMGYRRIVLLGVDLGGSTYYFSSDTLAVVHKTIDTFAKSPTDPHPTTTSLFGVPVQEYLAAYREFVLAPAGIELLVGSPQSLLAQTLPVYRFE